MENAVIYARYSSTNQTENSIEAQIEAGMQYANTHKYNVINTYADRAKTGTNDNREAFQAMLRDTDKKNFTVIIVWKIDRFGRNREEIAVNKYRCKRNNVRVEYVAENIIDGPEGVILESVLEGFAEYYSKQLSQNCKRGLDNVIRKGQYAGGKCPLGYKVVNKKYVIDEDGAKKIKGVFKMFNAGFTYAEIARTFGLRDVNIKVYLTNPIYYSGELVRGGIHVPNVFTPIIDELTFTTANEKINKRQRYCKPLEYPLSGKLYCSKCGKKFVGHKGDRFRYYKCLCKNKCAGHIYTLVRAEYLEQEILNNIRDLLMSEESINLLTDAVYEKLKLRVKKYNQRQSKETLMLRKENLLDAIEKGIADMDDVKERLDKINEELSKITIVNLPQKSEVKKFIYEMKNLNEDRILINSLIERIDIDPITKEYAIKFCPSQFCLQQS